MRLSPTSWLRRTRGDGPPVRVNVGALRGGSPHTWGWTHLFSNELANWTGSPAHAGMDPTTRRAALSRNRLPRIRGDGPPCSRSHSRDVRAPRTRGVGLIPRRCRSSSRRLPVHAGMDRSRSASASGASSAPPHTRGMDPCMLKYGKICGGSPAHAGMARSSTHYIRRPKRIPRMRGDAPWKRSVFAIPAIGSLACAGMDPAPCRARRSAT